MWAGFRESFIHEMLYFDQFANVFTHQSFQLYSIFFSLQLAITLTFISLYLAVTCSLSPSSLTEVRLDMETEGLHDSNQGLATPPRMVTGEEEGGERSWELQ